MHFLEPSNSEGVYTQCEEEFVATDMSSKDDLLSGVCTYLLSLINSNLSI